MASFSSLLDPMYPIRRPSALTALRTLVFRHVPFLKPQWPSLHWRPKARALRTTSPLVGREERAAFGNYKTQEVLGAQQPDLVPAGAALSARAVFLVDGRGRANRIESWLSNQQSGRREDGAAAAVIGLRSPTRRRSRASPSSPSWPSSLLPDVRGLFLVDAARSWVLLLRRLAVMVK